MGKPRVALVLSGGGARGAYEAGVIKYIRNELPEKIAKNIEFDIICGTSVGAINCCYLASSNDAPSLQGTGVAEIWSKLNIEGIYKVGMRELSRIPRFIFGSKRHKHFHFDKEIRRLGGFFDTSPLENLVSTENNWPNIRKNIHEGNLKALAINATHIASGKTHVFVDRFEGGLPPWSTDPHVDAFSVKIGPQHALASAAIPWVFPAVNIAGDLYCDGGVKLNTPISPALRLGADRLFVLGLSPEPNLFMNQDSNLDKNNIESYPSAIYLIGKLLTKQNMSLKD